MKMNSHPIHLYVLCKSCGVIQRQETKRMIGGNVFFIKNLVHHPRMDMQSHISTGTKVKMGTGGDGGGKL